jgi:hypothetical protein
MPGPLMGSWDTFAVHLPPLMGHKQVIVPSTGENNSVT